MKDMKAVLIMHKNTPKSSKNIFRYNFLKMVDSFNKRFKGTGCKITLKK